MAYCAFDSKTGKSVRPLGLAAITILRRIERVDDSPFVFPAETGDGFFQGYKTPWSHAIRKANLPGVSPHTLRHTMGSMTISSGEAMAFASAILGHSNPRSTAIYAHVQHDPARRAADRVSERIAAALAGAETILTTDAEKQAASDDQLLEAVAKILSVKSPDSERLRALLKLFVPEELAHPQERDALERVAA